MDGSRRGAMTRAMRVQTIGDTGSRMILFYGAGSGAGKSTLSRMIHEALERRGVEARYFAENDVLRSEAFAPYVEAVENGAADNVDVLLSSCREFIDEVDRSGQLYVVDSVLPCVDWLVSARCPMPQVRRFHAQVNRLLTPLNPIQVFLTGDTRTFLDRAVDDRGMEWAKALCLERCQSDDVIPSLLAYFDTMREAASDLLDDWPYGKIVVDTAADDLSTCANDILRQLGLAVDSPPCG